MRRLFGVWVAAVLAVVCTAMPALAAGGQVTAGGQNVTFDVQPAVVDGQLMVPVRAVAEALGGRVYWENGKVVIKTDKHTVTLTVGKSVIQIDGQDVDLKSPVVLSQNRTLVPASFLVTFYGETLQIDNPALKDPAAMAYMDRLSKAIPKNADLAMTQATTLTFSGDLPAGMPNSTTTVTRMEGQIRGADAMLTTTISSPALPGETLQMVTVARAGKTYVGTAGQWQPIDISQVPAGLVQAFAASANPAALVREAHMGEKRTVQGKTLQDVSFTVDSAVVAAAIDQLIQQTAGALASEVKAETSWDTIGMTYSFGDDGMLAAFAMDAGATLTITEMGQTLTIGIRIHSEGTYTPNDAAIAWPADLPD